MIFINTEQFLKLFHSDSPIHFRAIGRQAFNEYGTYEELKDKLSLFNDMNFNIYFTVNSGGTKHHEINKINAVFIDLDCGRDKNKQYYSIEHVKKYKDKQLRKIKEFPIQPTVIVETRNGLHVYWLLKERDNVTHEQFIQCQSLLIQYFNSDPAVKTVERIMRLPGYNWCKDVDNKYKCIIYSLNDSYTYTITDIIDQLNKLNNSGDCDRRVDKLINYTLFSHTVKSVNVKAIVEGEINKLREILKPVPIVLENQAQFYKYITEEIDLRKFLGVNSYGSFECVFHNDCKPSAGIFISDRKQHFYKCHSGSCSFMGNIIRCVERLRKCNRPDAIDFIRDVYQIEVKDTVWQQKQKNILRENKRMLMNGDFEETYPEVYRLIRNYIPLLNVMHDIAIDNVYDEENVDDKNNVVFYASISKICKAMGLNNVNGRIPDRIGLLAFLLLIKKLREEQVPVKLIERNREYKKNNRNSYMVNFFSIPSYSDDHMKESFRRALEYVNNNITMRGWSRELLQRTFGEEIANEIYPQFEHRKITTKSAIRTSQIHKIAMSFIEERGYVLEKEITEELIREYEKSEYKYSKNQLERQIKKSLQEMLDAYGWKREKLTNDLKDKLNLKHIKRCPFIIYKEQ